MSKTIAVGRKGHKSMICPLTAIYCDDLIWKVDACRGAVFQNGIAAKRIHDAFLEDILRFIGKSQVIEVICMRALFLRCNNITLIYWGGGEIY